MSVGDALAGHNHSYPIGILSRTLDVPVDAVAPSPPPPPPADQNRGRGRHWKRRHSTSSSTVVLSFIHVEHSGRCASVHSRLGPPACGPSSDSRGAGSSPVLEECCDFGMEVPVTEALRAANVPFIDTAS
jgi:hypothetical protein